MDHDETQVLNNVKVNIIQGAVHGIVESDFSRLHGYIEPLFKNVWWENDTLFINNRDYDPYFGTFDELENVFTSIAGCITPGKYGKLGFIGLVGKREIIGCVFLGNRKWELLEYNRPEAPDWYKTEEWYKMEKWQEEMEWDELFKRR